MSDNPYPDSARAMRTLNRFLDGHALRPPKMGARKTISANISQVAHAGLKQIAKDLGYIHGGDGNVSLLLEAIGTRTLQVTQPALQARSLD